MHLLSASYATQTGLHHGWRFSSTAIYYSGLMIDQWSKEQKCFNYFHMFWMHDHNTCMYSHCMVNEVMLIQSLSSLILLVCVILIKLCQPNCIFIHSPAQCILPSWACYCEGDDDDNWRTGLWWPFPTTGGWGRNCLSASLLHSLDYLPGTNTSPVEQFAGKLLILQ